MSYLDLVNVRMGTRTDPRFSHGNALPLTARPFGMAPFCLQTDAARGNWFFEPDKPYTEGVRLTHQPSPWLGDYGSFLMTPQNDCVSDHVGGAWSSYRIGDAVMRPDYLKVKLLRPGCTFELTPTERCGLIRLTFDNDRPSVLTIFPTRGKYEYRFDAAKNTLYGVTDGHAGDACADFRMYYALRFGAGQVDWDRCVTRGEGGTACAHAALIGRQIEVRIGLSYISCDMADAAIDREIGGCSFEDIRAEAAADWEEKLGRLIFETDNERQKRTFYSCLWRVFLFPRIAWEVGEGGQPVHHAPVDGKPHPGVRYTDNGFWDTSRTVYPLFSLIARREFALMLEGFVNEYKESGWLPRWLSFGELGCMPSTLIDAVIAQAAVSGIGTREVLSDALEGMLHHANNECADRRFGRNGALSYIKYGYVPRNEQRESVNLTLDAAYGDWCIATVAEKLGRDELIAPYMARSKNYKNIFDPATGFMRGRDTEGKMADNFDPFVWGGEYTEGSAWQSTFFVPHDVEGLCELYGGKDAFLAKLDELFAAPPAYRVLGYGEEIHEMSEMAVCDFGQCAISNQPSFHFPFFYAYLGQPDKTAYWVRRLCDEAFSPEDDGFPGDEDNGTMAAWYIFAMMGRYPLCPGKPFVVFPGAADGTIKRPGGSPLEVE